MFRKGQNVEMTVEGLATIRLKPDGTIRQHRNGTPFSSTGVVMSSPRGGENIVVRLDSSPKNNSGEYYAAKLWKPIGQDVKTCYICDETCERPDLHRKLSRGPREGQTIGPLCNDCEQTLEAQVLLEPLQNSKS